MTDLPHMKNERMGIREREPTRPNNRHQRQHSLVILCSWRDRHSVYLAICFFVVRHLLLASTSDYMSAFLPNASFFFPPPVALSEATPTWREIDDGKRHLGLFCVSSGRKNKQQKRRLCAASIRLIELSRYMHSIWLWHVIITLLMQ